MSIRHNNYCIYSDLEAIYDTTLIAVEREEEVNLFHLRSLKEKVVRRIIKRKINTRKVAKTIRAIKNLNNN